MKRMLCLMLLLTLGLPLPVVAGEGERPRIGLVLSGGGARGAAHVGVLKVIDELHIPIDYIAGTSMGAIIGGLYASGMTAEQIEEALAEVDWGDVLRDDTVRRQLSFRRKSEDRDFLVRADIGYKDGEVKLPTGLLQGQKLLLLLQRLTRPVSGIGRFDDLPIPFRAVATDIATGQKVVIDHGSLALAMRASSSIPSIFAAVEWEDRLLVDGGVSDNLPVQVAREMGADILIVVDISTPLASREEITNAIDIADQLTTIMTRSNTERSIALLGDLDIFLVPDLGKLGTADFTRSMEAVPLGEKAARQRSSELSALSVNREAWQAYRQRTLQRKPSSEPPVIAFIRIDNDSAISDEVLQARLGLHRGDRLSENKLEQGIARIYGMDLFKEVSYRLVEEDGEAGIVVEVKEKPWGPTYLDYGIKLYGSWDSGGQLSLGAGYTRTALNPLGGEYRLLVSLGENHLLFGEFYQPLSVEQPWFVNPRLKLSRRNIGYYEDGHKVAEYYFDQALVALEAGKEFGNWGEFRLGYRYAYDDIDVHTGPGYFEDQSYNEGSVFVQLAVDTMDNLYFPSLGQDGLVRFTAYNRAFGGDHDFEQLHLRWSSARTRGTNTLVLHGQAAYTFGSDAPVYGHQLLGGFLRLSGYDRYELSGQHSALGVAGVLHRLNAKGAVVPIYVGGTLEAGNVWQTSSEFGSRWIGAGSLFLGLDTYLGPLYLGFGAAEGGHRTAFIYLGAPF